MRKRNIFAFITAVVFLYLFCINSAVQIPKTTKAPNVFSYLYSAFHEKFLFPVMSPSVPDKAVATAICVDGEELVICENEQTAKKAVQELTFYVSSFLEGALVSATPKGVLSYRTTLYPKSEISDYSTALSVLKGTPSDSGYYTIKKDDTKESIAKTFGISEKALSLLNPDSLLKEGERLLISIPVPRLSLKITTNETKTLTTPVEYRYEYDSTLSAGDRKIESQGKAGIYEITETVTYENFIEIRRVTESKVTISEPSAQIIKTGTMPPASTGRFIRPVSGGEITSAFGIRERDDHKGIDIGLDYGLPIHASDGGVVITSGVVEGYGNTVIIDHKNGFTTLYAHCDTLLVYENQTVVQGEQIATVGSTGISTGPHLHFEILKDNVPLNPELYIDFQ